MTPLIGRPAPTARGGPFLCSGLDYVSGNRYCSLMETTKRRTIGRNATRQIAKIKASHTRALLFSLSNNFTAQELEDPARAWENLDKFGFAKLLDNGDGSYTIRVHSNLWIDLRTPKPPAPPWPARVPQSLVP